MMDFLRQRYNDFITEYDPYSQDEAPETLEAMLYNLLEIRDDFTDDPEFDTLKEVLEATIEQFKAAGIEAY